MPTVEKFPEDTEDHAFNVVIAHPNEVIKNGIEKIMAENPRVIRAVSCDNWPRALSLLAARAEHRSVLILPRSLAGDKADLSAIFGSSNEVPFLKVLFLLDDAEVHDAVSKAETWADGFLVESTLTAQSLGEALDQLGRGQMPMPSAVARSLLTEVARFRELSAMQYLQLTHRELQTLQLMVDGLSNKEIARRLRIGVNSVKRHVSTVLAKLNCSNRTKAAAYAIDVGLVGKGESGERLTPPDTTPAARALVR